MHNDVWSCIMSAAQTWTVGVTGATGYAGGEVCRLLAGPPNLRLAGVHANSSAGRRLGELQPHLLPFADLEVQASEPAALAAYDVRFAALPHGRVAPAPGVPAPAGGAGGAGGAPRGLAPTGLPERPGQGEQLPGARRIAVPG